MNTWIRTLAITAAAVLSMFVVSSTSLGKVGVRDLILRSTAVGDEFVSAEISGLLRNECTRITGTRVDSVAKMLDMREIRIYLETSTGPESLCTSASEPFIEEVYLGRLDIGRYAVKVYENDSLVFEKTVAVPFDIADPAYPSGYEFPYQSAVSEAVASDNNT